MRILFWVRAKVLNLLKVDTDVGNLEHYIQQLRGRISRYQHQIDDRDIAIKHLRDEMDALSQRIIELQQKLYIERSNKKVAQEVSRIIGHKSGLEVFKGGKE